MSPDNTLEMAKSLKGPCLDDVRATLNLAVSWVDVLEKPLSKETAVERANVPVWEEKHAKVFPHMGDHYEELNKSMLMNIAEPALQFIESTTRPLCEVFHAEIKNALQDHNGEQNNT